jgi:hypothetical protein
VQLRRVAFAAVALAGAIGATVGLAIGGSSSSTQPAARVSGTFAAGIVSIEWSPVAGAGGYRMLRDGRQVATAGAAATSTRFAVTAGKHTLSVFPTPPAIATSTSSTTTAAGGGQPLPVYEVTLTPHWLSPLDSPSSNYQAVWAYATSPATPYRGPDSQHTIARYLLLDPRVRDADGRPGQDEWWFVVELLWPTSYDANQHGAWGRELNFHNVAGDAGPGGGIGWSFGPLNSALGLDWLPGNPAPTVNVEPAQSGGLNYLLPVPARDVWHTYVIHFIAGRTDGSTVRAGAVTVWADGVKTLDLQNANTVWRAQAPDGQSYTQRWFQLWEGDYTRGLQVVAKHDLLLTRIGTTLAAAIADRPTLQSTTAPGQFWDGTGLNLGPPSITQVGLRDSNLAKLP